MSGWNRTVEAVQRQVEAMAADVFEVELFKPDADPGEAIMIPRAWGWGFVSALNPVGAAPKSGWPEHLHPALRKTAPQLEDELTQARSGG